VQILTDEMRALWPAHTALTTTGAVIFNLGGRSPRWVRLACQTKAGVEGVKCHLQAVAERDRQIRKEKENGGKGETDDHAGGL
jgi:hypothetical protein